jgi:protein TonB
VAPALAPPAAALSGPPGPPVAAPIAALAKAAPVIAAHEGANYLKNPRPAYPELALRRDWQGEVLLRVRVSPEGRAIGISVERSSGRDVLDEAAQEAVRGWTFVPSRQGGVAIAGWVTVPIVFHLQEGE